MSTLDRLHVPAVAAIALVALLPAIVARAAQPAPADPFADPYALHCSVWQQDRQARPGTMKRWASSKDHHCSCVAHRPSSAAGRVRAARSVS